MVHMLRDEFKRNISSALDTDEEFFTVGEAKIARSYFALLWMLMLLPLRFLLLR